MFCPNCGNNCGDAKFCANCGTNLNNVVIAVSNSDIPSDPKSEIIRRYEQYMPDRLEAVRILRQDTGMNAMDAMRTIDELFPEETKIDSASVSKTATHPVVEVPAPNTSIPVTAPVQQTAWKFGMSCPHCGGTQFNGNKCAFCGADLFVGVAAQNNGFPYGVYRGKRGFLKLRETDLVIQNGDTQEYTIPYTPLCAVYFKDYYEGYLSIRWNGNTYKPFPKSYNDAKNDETTIVFDSDDKETFFSIFHYLKDHYCPSNEQWLQKLSNYDGLPYGNYKFYDSHIRLCEHDMIIQNRKNPEQTIPYNQITAVQFFEPDGRSDGYLTIRWPGNSSKDFPIWDREAREDETSILYNKKDKELFWRMYRGLRDVLCQENTLFIDNIPFSEGGAQGIPYGTYHAHNGYIKLDKNELALKGRFTSECIIPYNQIIDIEYRKASTMFVGCLKFTWEEISEVQSRKRTEEISFLWDNKMYFKIYTVLKEMIKGA